MSLASTGKFLSIPGGPIITSEPLPGVKPLSAETINNTLAALSREYVGTPFDFTMAPPIDMRKSLQEILPKELEDAVYGRQSMRYMKTHQYFLRYTDQWSSYSSEDLWSDLANVSRYLQVYIITYVRQQKESEEGPIVLYNAGVPELLLDSLKLSFDSSVDYTINDPNSKIRCLPYLVVEILGFFVHKHSPTFLAFTEKLFRALQPKLECLVDIALGKLSWIESFSVVHFFSNASESQSCCYWVMKRPDVVQALCKYLYRSTEIVEEMINRGEITKRNEYLFTILSHFQSSDQLLYSARLLGVLTVNHSAFFLRNIMRYSRKDYEWFLSCAMSMRRANVIARFSYTFKQLMSWVQTGHFLNFYLGAVRYYLDMRGGVEDLLMTDMDYCDEHDIPRGIDSLKFWGHASLFPSRLAVLACNALSLHLPFGSHWCVLILTHILHNCSPEVVAVVIEAVGPELLDLAHMLEWQDPEKVKDKQKETEDKIPVQTKIMEALLRHAGFTHKMYERKESYQGELKAASDIPECCLEAALYCRRASLEGKMSLELRQDRVREADTKKDLGNKAFKDGNYSEAVIFYTEAMAVCPLSARSKHAVYYRNRAECYLRNDDYVKAVRDCNRSLCLDRTQTVKVHWRRARAYQKLGLIYPAWLDMKAIEIEWSEQSGVDFMKMLSEFAKKLGMLEKNFDPDRKTKTFESKT